MQNAESVSLEQMEEFLRGSASITIEAKGQAEIYGFVERVLVEQEYHRQGKKRRGRIRAYLCKLTGLSQAQMTRLIRLHRKDGRVKATDGRRRRFPSKYTTQDVALLAEVDVAHEVLSGPATRRILKREYEEYGKPEYGRLAEISVSHLYNLRQRRGYRERVAQYAKTKPRVVSIGERRCPDPRGQPGWVRVDTVHQGDREQGSGVYHVNAVDSVTQWEVVGCAGGLSERFLQPVLEAMLHQFPFAVKGFHSDNGSEFINRRVEKLLNKLLVEEFTKSRANRSNDNALVEGKNGAVIRKHIGYGPIEAEHAEAMQKFYTAHFNVYLNYHRPCGYATVKEGERGKREKVYKTEDYRTPYEKLKSLPGVEGMLKEGLRLEQLERTAKAMSDTEFARRMKKAKLELLRKCRMKDLGGK
jgi:hypothetical protein